VDRRRDEEYLSKGSHKTYTEENLRYSQTIPLDMYEEINSGRISPPRSTSTPRKGWSTNSSSSPRAAAPRTRRTSSRRPRRSSTPRRSKSSSSRDEDAGDRGVPAVPPRVRRRRDVGRGGAQNRQTRLHRLPRPPSDEGEQGGQAFRDLEMEGKLLAAARKSGYGAQFGGKHFAHDVRVVRLPRHGASCPVAMGVSCSADRNVKAKITRDGIWLEELDRNRAPHPGEVSRKARARRREGRPEPADEGDPRGAVEVPGHHAALPHRDDHRRPRHRPREAEGADRQGGGAAAIRQGPPIYYAGPAKTPKGMPSGSFGPTTAGGWTRTWIFSSPTAGR